MTKQTVEIDTRTLIVFWSIPLVIGLLWLFLKSAATGLIILGISIFLAIALKPLVNRLDTFFKKHFGINKSHKTASAVLAYIIVILLVISIIAIVGPVVVNETSNFIEQLPQTFSENSDTLNGINEFGKNFGIADLKGEIANAVTSFAENISKNLGTTIITGISTMADVITKGLLILILTLLFMLEGPNITKKLWKSIGSRKEDEKPIAVAKNIVHRMTEVISTYVSRQVLVAFLDGVASMLIVFVLSFIFNFSTSLAIPMGLIAFISYLIPMFGQFINVCIVGAVIAFSNPIAAIIYIAAYIIYAQIENNVISPKIQGDALKLPAVIILAAMVIGMYMFGLLGAIIAIPIAGCIRVLIEEIPNIKAARE